jgi:hypothetical protein
MTNLLIALGILALTLLVVYWIERRHWRSRPKNAPPHWQMLQIPVFAWFGWAGVAVFWLIALITWRIRIVAREIFGRRRSTDMARSTPMRYPKFGDRLRQSREYHSNRPHR